MNGFFDKVKKASKGVVDAGAKTMLKVCWNAAEISLSGNESNGAIWNVLLFLKFLDHSYSRSIVDFVTRSYLFFVPPFSHYTYMTVFTTTTTTINANE